MLSPFDGDDFVINSYTLSNQYTITLSDITDIKIINITYEEYKIDTAHQRKILAVKWCNRYEIKVCDIIYGKKVVAIGNDLPFIDIFMD